jgi:hypothetical protein
VKPPEQFAEALVEVEANLDWSALGRAYCSEGGDDFFGDGDRDAIRDTGLQLADDLATALGALPARGPRRSLYVGAALAELAPMLCESIVLGREVLAFSMDGDETRQLNAALARASERVGCALPRIETVALESRTLSACDHLWIVSVLNDPEAFPALHDALYRRRGTELATARGDLATEERRARSLLAAVLAPLCAPAVLTTTDEELDLVTEACRKRGFSLAVPEFARLSAIVGDPVRVCAVLPA